MGLFNLFRRGHRSNIVGFQARVVPPGAFPGVLLGSRRRGVDRGLFNLFGRVQGPNIVSGEGGPTRGVPRVVTREHVKDSSQGRRKGVVYLFS